ncbi:MULTISPECIES: hypothetical protein [unclassified Schlesneria]|uniref:hypothetical protein n=1 Tax=Schlesneria TaxID=656899 RepID=UPI00359FE32E
MPANADQFLRAIETEQLSAVPYTNKDTYSIRILIEGAEVDSVGCLLADRPFARPSRDGRSVEIFPSPGMPDGFEVQCSTHEEAVLIAESIDNCLETAYLKLVDPEHSA